MSIWQQILEAFGGKRDIPKVKSTFRMFADTKKNIKVNSIQKASCGLLVCTYYNDSRKNSWIVLLDGIVSGIAKLGGYWILAIMDGANPGIASTKGWKIAGQFQEVAVAKDTIYGFAKNGEVYLLDKDNGKVKKTVARTGSKAQRARVKDGLVYWATADYDSLWCSNGKDSKKLYEWTDGDKPTGTTSGSLFNTSLTFDGSNIIVARSVTNRGYEVWKVEVK